MSVLDRVVPCVGGCRDPGRRRLPVDGAEPDADGEWPLVRARRRRRHASRRAVTRRYDAQRGRARHRCPPGRHDAPRSRSRTPRTGLRGPSGVWRAGHPPDGWPIGHQRHGPAVRRTRDRCESGHCPRARQRHRRSRRPGRAGRSAEKQPSVFFLSKTEGTASSIGWRSAATGPSAMFTSTPTPGRSWVPSTAFIHRWPLGKARASWV